MAKVLLVEDDNNLREIYQARLMAEGYDIVAAQNGEEALVVAKQNKPDLIISDVMMPRISGFEMLDILRNTDELKNTRVIMLTALGQAEDQKRANGLGADKYLVKSQVTLEDIVNAAKELLGEDGGVADVPPAPAVPDPVAAAEPATPPAAPAPAEPATPAATAAIPVATPPEPVAAPTPAPAPATPAATPAPVAPPEPPAPPAPVAAPAPTAPPTPPAPAATPAVAPTVATTTVPVVEPPAAAPAPAPVISMPSADPAPATASAAAAVSDAATQTLEAEEAALQSQIDSYASAPAETPMAVNPEEAKAEASNNQTITTAVEQLNNPTPEAPLQPPSVANAPAAAPTPPAPPAPVAAPAPTAPTPSAAPATPPTPPAPATEPTAPAPASGDSTSSVAGRKVIQPISDPAAKPDLNALLAKEEAAAPTAPTPSAAPVVNGAAAPTPPTPPAPAPGQSFDPNKAL